MNLKYAIVVTLSALAFIKATEGDPKPIPSIDKAPLKATREEAVLDYKEQTLGDLGEFCADLISDGQAGDRGTLEHRFDLCWKKLPPEARGQYSDGLGQYLDLSF